MSFTRTKSFTRQLCSVAYNFVPRIDESKLVVKRKGHIIKGETEKNITAARKERRQIVNAMKRARREMRAA